MATTFVRTQIGGYAPCCGLKRKDKSMRECSHCESLLPLYYEVCPVCGKKLGFNDRVLRIKDEINDKKDSKYSPFIQESKTKFSEIFPDD